MFVDASISRAGVSKAKPQPWPGRPSRHARTPANGCMGGRQAVATAAAMRHTGRAGRLVRFGIQIEGQRDARGGGVGGGRRYGESGRRCASGRGSTSGRSRAAARQGRTARGDDGRRRPSWPAARDGDARVSWRGVTSGRSSASERGGTSGWGLSSGRGASGTGAARIGSGDDGDEERRFGGETTKCRSERRWGLYRTPPFVTGRLPNRDKRPFSIGLCYCDNPPRKIPYYRLRPIHFGH
jgi:hypothetical protein